MSGTASYPVTLPGPVDWTALVAYLQNYLQQDQPNAAFSSAVSQIIYNAELRIYRELDFLATRKQNASLTFTRGSRTLDLSQITDTTVSPPYPVVIQRVAAIVPAGAAPSAGQRVQYLETSLDALDFFWPNEAAVQSPLGGTGYWAPLDGYRIVVAPTPDQAYTAEITGTWRPAPMSAANPTTWIGTNLPDLLFAACMVQGAGFLRDYGQQSDDPKLALSWETVYQTAKQSALEEEQRRKGLDTGFQPFSPTPLGATSPAGPTVTGR